MTDSPILSQVALCHSPFIDRRRIITATRLTVLPLRPDAKADAQQLLAAVDGVWPAGGARVSLNVLCEPLLAGLLRTRPPANVMIEVPSFMAADAAHGDALRALHAGGCTLLLKGRPAEELPRDVLPCFGQAIVDADDDRRFGRPGAPAPAPGVQRRIRPVQSGVRTIAAMEAAFAAGIETVVGWPLDDAPPAASKAGAAPLRGKGTSAVQVILELIDGVDREAPVARMEQTLRRDPTVAFRLLRFINSPAFGLRVEISSFSHAIAMLGRRPLKRWLALLLATASDDPNAKPLMFAAVRRGLLMEEFARASGDDEMKSEMFVCGVFSLLDRTFGQPFAELLTTVPVPDRVVQALARGAGPYHGWLELVRAIESESLYDVRNASETLLQSAADVNRALLRALALAGDLG